MSDAPARQPSSSSPHAPATAADVMRPALTTVEPDAHLAAAAYLMRHAHTTSLVVVDDDQAKRPIGLITESDVVHAVADGQDVNDARIRDLMTMSPTVINARTTIPDAARSMMAGHFRHLPVVDIADVCRALLDPSAKESARPPA